MSAIELHGKQMIGNTITAAGTQQLFGINPASGEQLVPAFHEAVTAEVDQALGKAADVFDAFRQRSQAERADFLEAIADEIEALGDDLLLRAGQETGLPAPRLSGERTRAVNQARLFARVVREGSWVDARIDRGDAARKPAPKPDVRRMLMGIGPVVVFGASNFPLAISVAGTDTISALGAGCPVVVKAHPGHPGTSELVGRAILNAAKRCSMPDGVFSLLQGGSHELGAALVRHPATAAVGFTGSLRGGRALYDIAVSRPGPIPVYAEMGSINPVFVLPGALSERGEEIARGYVQSVVLGSGQFCTNPGLLLGLEGEPLTQFAHFVQQACAEAAPMTMLHGGIRDAYREGTQRIRDTNGVSVVGESVGTPDEARTQAGVAVFRTDEATLSTNPHLMDEVFGPTSILVNCRGSESLQRIAEGLEGHLTATLHGTEADLREYAGLVRVLERKVGRLIFNGFPTGIEVCAAMHHGGPYPATTDSHCTSIGTASILRFARPVCYQNFPDAALPEQLRNRNSLGLWRLVDNELTHDDC